MSKIKNILIKSFMAFMMLTSVVMVTSCTVLEDFTDKNIHVKVTVPGKAPTCTEDGLTDKICCTDCGKIYEDHKVIPVLGHTEVIGSVK